MSILRRYPRNISVFVVMTVSVAVFFLLSFTVNIAHAAVIVTPPTLCPNVDSSGAIECANGAGAEPVWCGGQCQGMPTVDAPYGRVNCDSCTAICPSVNPYECPSAPEKCQDREGTDCAAANRSYTCDTGGGISQTCGSCLSGYLDCSGICRSTTPQGCEPGQVWDTCSQTCTDPYIKAFTVGTGPIATPQSADVNIGGDLNIASGKAIRVDTLMGDSTLNIGNWGGGGAVLLNVSGNIDADDFCWNNGASCISTGDGGLWDIVTGGINFSDGKVGIADSTPSYALDVTGDIRATGGIGLGGQMPSSFSGLNVGGSWSAINAVGGYYGIYGTGTVAGLYGYGPSYGVTAKGDSAGLYFENSTATFAAWGRLADKQGAGYTGINTTVSVGTGGIFMNSATNTTVKLAGSDIDGDFSGDFSGAVRAQQYCFDNATNCITSWPTGPWTESGSDVYRSSGNVGIGTSAVAGHKLYINDTAGNTYGLRVNKSGKMDSSHSAVLIRSDATYAGIDGIEKYGVDIEIGPQVWNGNSYGMSLQNLATNDTSSNGRSKYGLKIVSQGLFTGGTGAASNNWGLYVDASGADNNYAAYFGGNVGIGDSTPAYMLDVTGTINASSIRLGGVTNSSWPTGPWTESGSDVYRSSGNVGIGTASPAAMLDVKGDVSILGRFNVGLDSSAIGSHATAIGRNATAQTFGSTAIGYSADALTGSYAMAFGYDAQATGHFSTAINRSTASGYYGSSIGLFATASGSYSTAIGHYATASGSDSYAFGSEVTASGSNAITIGRYVDATNLYSVVIGRGASATSRLVNNDDYSIYLGSNSNIPTLVIGSSAGPGTFGKVGIGTKTPAYTLDVAGYGNFTSGIGAGGRLPTSGYGVYAQGTTMGGRFHDNGGSGYAYLGYGDYGMYGYGNTMGGYFKDLNSGEYTYISYSDYSLYGSGWVQARAQNGYNIRMGGDSFGGDVEIGSTTAGVTALALWNPTSAVRMDVYGGTYYNVSSIRWKDNVEVIPNALDIVMALRGVNFTWKEGAPSAGEGLQYGMIAEEVGEVIPEIVVWDEDAPGYATDMNYTKLIPVFVEAVKEQQEQIEGLEMEIADLRERIGAVDALLSR